ncbi:exodeoxyribonuclease VII small subunit [Helicobacter mesocricetorum]|uniref:exodeoxyribonuclease VII small subunit n=1 Tax=Helicobacter mesocricetorum TaxID=87012 RepID=UPI001F3AC57E|nr:exodeoxyribonuclease VII small subunit [Helicobacter mesocricetorum]
MNKKIKNDDIKKDSFENYLTIVQQYIEKLSDEDITLHQSMEFYKEGMQTLKKAQKMLEDAKIQCQELKAQFDKQIDKKE